MSRYAKYDHKPAVEPRATVALVSCSKQKQLSSRHFASELYTSPLFRKAFDYALETYPEVRILSAEHHLVSPWQTLTPYDTCLDDYTEEERAEWAHSVMVQLATEFSGQELDLVLFAGATYAEPLKWQLPEFKGWTLTEPLAGLQIGERLQWFGQRRAA